MKIKFFKIYQYFPGIMDIFISNYLYLCHSVLKNRIIYSCIL